MVSSVGQQRDDAGGQAQPDRQADLRKAGIKAALFGRGILVGHQHRAAPFAAEADALQDAQRQQRDRSPYSDLRVGRNQPDQERGDAHDHQGQDQHALAADPVAEMAEDDAPERTRDEADSERRVGEQRGDDRIAGRKIQLVEHDAGDDAVKKEIIPFDGRADQRREDDPSSAKYP